MNTATKYIEDLIAVWEQKLEKLEAEELWINRHRVQAQIRLTNLRIKHGYIKTSKQEVIYQINSATQKLEEIKQSQP
jgi:hypothetical protein